ncbi:MAG: choice-of-anchor Q domain-containing protein [Bryobacteraceae bacterium]
MATLTVCCALAQTPRDVTLSVAGSDGGSVGAYRWVLEEDRTYHVQFDAQGNPITDPNTLSVSFHPSHMPVAGKGEATGTATLTLPDATKHYYVSVLPKTAGSYTIGAATIAPTTTSVTVQVNKLPLPTAQITIFVYHDNAPLNNAADLPREVGLGGFQIVVEDAGGRYGISAGTLSQDAYGNMLGQVYQKDKNGNYVLDANGNPIPAVDNKGVPIVEPLVTGPCPGDTCGMLTIKNLWPGKYGVSVVPPSGQGWQQTSTIEGTKIIDAWVKANEPSYFAEFGPPGAHVEIGFIQPFTDATVLKGGATITGQVVNLHLSRPPDYAFYNGVPFAHTTPWVGLNDAAGVPATSKAVFAKRVNADGTFSIPNVPPGNYQLAIWDDNLDLIFGFHSVTVNAGGPPYSCNTLAACELGDIPVFQWFTRLEHFVFSDDGCAGTPQFDPTKAGNGFREACETGIPERTVNIRWRDGTINQSAPTDPEGFVPFDEVFPFFAWQVAEVDYARDKATGVSVVVDDGGPIDPNNTWSFDGVLNPQPQTCTAADVTAGTDGCASVGAPRINPNTGDNLVRTEVGPELLQAFQGFIGQTSAFAWGKSEYLPGENGGISGIVFYDTTRAENDPRYNAGEVFTPGIPGVTLKLHVRSAADPATLIQVATVQTDSWDTAPPVGCQGAPFTFRGSTKDCYDGLRNFNQVRKGVFDGGYAFTECYTVTDAVTGKKSCVAPGTAGASATPEPLPVGEYIVEVVPPVNGTGARLYEVEKEEDKNVDFGDNYTPSPNLLPPVCVGDRAALGYPATVPAELTLFPGVPVAAEFAGQARPLCNMKQVFVNDGQNSAADFFLFTETPIAGHIYGFILDDASNEFDRNSPVFGEKYAPPFMPVSIRDWTGKEISRTYSDEYGVYSALVPSTYTANVPSPSGISANMITACMNARLLPDGNEDPRHNPLYSEFCYTFQYMPGATTYLDTPVIPVAAHAGPDRSPLDCEFPEGTPRIATASVPTNGVGGGPYAGSTGQQIVINAIGTVAVPNPAYCPASAGAVNCPNGFDENKTTNRDFGFGAYTPGQSTVTIGGVPLTGVSWSTTQITGTIAGGTTTGQLVVKRGDNSKSTITGITVTIGLGRGQSIRPVAPSASANAHQIQNAIDAAAEGDLILVSPGLYRENVILWKPVRLQGWGETTRIDAVNAPAEKRQQWRTKVQNLVASGSVDILSGQEVAAPGLLEPVLFASEEGSGIFVLAKRNRYTENPNARIDGFSISGADSGGGIVVNGYAKYLEISNNRITNNQGDFGGGIRVGHPELTNPNATSFTDADNDNIRIHNNHISQNGGLGGAGGGVSLCTGAENYLVTQNYVCGNFSTADGGGIGHLGLSNGGAIVGNTILFNENFNQGLTAHGGGIFIGGQAPLVGQTITPGAGSVRVNANLIQGNTAGAGDGGGIRLSNINGAEVASNRNKPEFWYQVDIFNNMIVNNVAGMAGAGISLQDAAKVNIIHNTIAHNDSTATAGSAFFDPNQSTPQPAGVVSYAHSSALADAAPAIGTFSNPTMRNDIVFWNRRFYFKVDTTVDPPAYTLVPAAPAYSDLAVVGAAGSLTCTSCRTTQPGDAAGAYSNPLAFVTPYFNGARGTTLALPEVTTALQAPPAFDEGGNFIRLRFGPLSLVGNYHLLPSSPAIDQGAAVTGIVDLLFDIDGQTRPFNAGPDLGADEVH